MELNFINAEIAAHMVEVVEDVEEVEMEEELVLPRRVRLNRERRDLFNELSEVEFKANFRFTKANTVRLVEMLADQLEHRKPTNLAMSPLEQVLLTLNILGGGNFFRTTALIANVGRSTVHDNFERVLRAINAFKPMFVKMPTAGEMRETADYFLAKYHLPGFAFGVDCTHFRFEDKPRGVPEEVPGSHADCRQGFFNRKHSYTFNCQVIGNGKRKILDIDNSWAGSTHDARIWANSDAKQYIDTHCTEFKIAGDSAYPLSPVMVAPFSKDEAAADEKKRLFNIRLCGLRTEMTENIYGMLKKRFPILRQLRFKMAKAQQVILCTAILHNICIEWGDEDLPDDQADLNDDDVQGPGDDHPADHQAAWLGAQERIHLMNTMPPATSGERRRMRQDRN